MSNVFEIIDSIRLWKGYSLREVSQRAEMAYTSFFSLMKRRSINISQESLGRIAKALDLYYLDLLPEGAMMQAYGTVDVRIPTGCTDEEAENILRKIIGEDYLKYLNEARINSTSADAKPGINRPITPQSHREQFKQSMAYLFEKLNEDGLLEVMRYTIELTQDSKYRISTDPKKKEDTEWQEKEQ